MIKITVVRPANGKRYGKWVMAKFLEIRKADPTGPLSKLFNQFNANDLHPHTLADVMRRESRRGNGRYYEKDKRWWAPKKRKVRRQDNVFYVTKDEGVLLGWTRHRVCDPYRIFILLSDESVEPFFAQLYGGHYVPTSSHWPDLESKDVIEHLEW